MNFCEKIVICKKKKLSNDTWCIGVYLKLFLSLYTNLDQGSSLLRRRYKILTVSLLYFCSIISKQELYLLKAFTTFYVSYDTSIWSLRDERNFSSSKRITFFFNVLNSAMLIFVLNVAVNSGKLEELSSASGLWSPPGVQQWPVRVPAGAEHQWLFLCQLQSLYGPQWSGALWPAQGVLYIYQTARTV